MASNGKVALVTGGGSGIGKASALALAREGFSLVVAGRRPEPLEAVVGEIEVDAGQGARGADRCRRPGLGRGAVRRRPRRHFGRLDVLFNNAGFGAAAPIEDLEWSRWKGVIDSIVHGTFLCTQQAFRIMKDQTPMGGRIINNGSISAHVPRPFSIAYTTAKHAVTGLTKSTSLDGRKYDISCGQIDVGNALTEMTQRMTARRAAAQRRGHDRADDGCRKRRPLGRADGDRHAGGQHPVPDGHGHQDAVRRPGIAVAHRWTPSGPRPGPGCVTT